MTKKRPEYIRCIQHTHAEKQKTSWCGEQLFSIAVNWAYEVKGSGNFVNDYEP